MSVLSVRGSQSPASRRVGLASGLVCLALAVLTAWASADHDTQPQGYIRTGPPSVEIYPTAERLPANLLRVYLVFDAAMSTGESRAHLRLVDDEGREVQRAFLQLEQELWDRSGRRLTVLFDPGRIKRGLRANVESGPPLVEGRRYRLAVDAGWRYADGRPLGAGASKAFEVVAPDRTAPDVDAWTIEPPLPGTRASLVLRFPEALDRALLFTALEVVTAAGESIRGDVEVAHGERAWAFTPERAWRVGEYGIRVSSEIEDVAGNSPRRVFDTEMFRTHPVADDVPSFLTRRFSISGAEVGRQTMRMRSGDRPDAHDNQHRIVPHARSTTKRSRSVCVRTWGARRGRDVRTMAVIRRLSSRQLRGRSAPCRCPNRDDARAPTGSRDISQAHRVGGT